MDISNIFIKNVAHDYHTLSNGSEIEPRIEAGQTTEAYNEALTRFTKAIETISDQITEEEQKELYNASMELQNQSDNIAFENGFKYALALAGIQIGFTQK